MKAARPYAKVFADAMNPFVRYDLDPHQSPRELTEQLRERMDDATSEDERSELRAAWELLTKKPTERVFLALEAGPDLRPHVTTRRVADPRKAAPRGLDVLPRAFLVPLSEQSQRARAPTPLADSTLSAYLSESGGRRGDEKETPGA